MNKFVKQPHHSMVLAVYPTLALLTANINEVRLSEGLRALLAGAIVGGMILGLSKSLVQDWQKAGLVTSILLVFFFSYGHVYNAIKGIEVVSQWLGRHRFLLPLVLAITVFALATLLRRSQDLNPITALINVLSLGLLLFPLYQITDFSVRDWLFVREQNARNAVAAAAVAESSLPDVYYIIADAYARDDVLAELYDLDNSTFLNKLEDMGFFVAECSRSNYPKTRLSLSSSLNLDYVENLGITANDQLDEFWRRIRRSVVRKTFEENGYTIVALQTGFYWTEWTDADVYLSNDDEQLGTLQRLIAFGALNSFEALLIRTTALRAALDLQPQLATSLVEAVDVSPLETHYELVEFSLNSLPQVAVNKSPKFVFAHLLVPHGPFVFDSQGNFTLEPRTLEEAYAAQVEYLNSRLLEILASILDNSTRPVVIILQGDHGAPGTQFSVDRMKILNAYYFPEARELLYPSISPVNSFRLVFNTYFGYEFAPLEDLSYFSTNEDFFDTSLISDDRPGCPTN